jgi:hypothetical protein
MSKTYLKSDHFNGGGSVKIIGAGRQSTTLTGNFPGFILYYPDDISGYCCIFVGVESLGVINNSADLASGAIQFTNMNPGSYIRDCTIRGMTGIDAQANMFTAEISDCDIASSQASGYPNSVGIYAHQVSVSNLKIVSEDMGIVMRGPGGSVSVVAVETSNTGLVMGMDRPAVFTGHITGTTLTIETWKAGHPMNQFQSNNWTLICPFTQPCAAGTIITGILSGSGKEGTYSVNISQNVASQTMGASFNNFQTVAATVRSFQTERTNTGVWILQAVQSSLDGLILTGTVGVGIQVDSASWSSASGGTITYNLNYPSPAYTQGTHDCSFDGFSNANYNQGYHVTCTWNGRTVTKTGTGGDPGAWVNGYATVSPLQNVCLYVSFAVHVTISHATGACSPLGGYKLDVSGTGWGALDHLVLANSVIGPLRAGSGNKDLHITNSYPGVADLATTFNELPGGSSASLTTRTEGEMYYIIDSNQATVGGTVTGGSGGTRGWVVWNGSNWTLMSK